jgi:glycolate dehydrogenase FAD-binding subunit
MILTPANLPDLSRQLAAASGRVTGVDLGALNRLVEHTPEDMTVTVEAGMALAALHAQLKQRGQWLPVDPANPERLTISDLINANVSGPRRFGYGTIRDYLLGITVALADGSVIHSGGKVVKNVAGYDLVKLFIGSRGSLGVVVETTFKLQPVPEVEQFVQAKCASSEEAGLLIEAVINSEITPVVLDLCSLVPQTFTVVLGFAGTRADVVWQLAKAGGLGFTEASSLDYEAAFWADPRPAHQVSVLPSKIVGAIRELNGASFVARAGNGVIYHRGAPVPHNGDLPLELMRRVKNAFDPNRILPDFPL